MSRSIRFAVACAATSLVAAVGAQAVLAAGDTDDHLSPAKTTVKTALKAGTTTSFTGTSGGVTVTSHCTASTGSFKTPAHGLGAVKHDNPTFTGCTDSLGGTDTVTTNSKNGNWTEKFVDAAHDEKSEKRGDHTRLTMPKAGVTVVSSVAPGCVITVAPSGPATITATYRGRTETFTNVSIPFSTSAGCPGGATTGTATFSGTYVWTPKVKDVS